MVIILSSVGAASIRKQGDQSWAETGTGEGVDGKNSRGSGWVGRWTAAPGPPSPQARCDDTLTSGAGEGEIKSRFFS